MEPTTETDMAALDTHKAYTCPNCGSAGMRPFYGKANAPAHSVVLLSSREQAINYPSGDIVLAFCSTCGFISNVVFDHTLHDYATDYEATQSYSPTFNKFARRVAHTLIERYDLHDKDIIEIGCGQGEFLIMLAEDGPNRGIGFDPAYRIDEPIETSAQERLQFVSDYYSEKYTDHHGDFVVCKMTLEHIDKTDEFIATVRRSVGDRQNAIIFFQIPNGEYVMKDVAFWDVYYEHCSYFSPASLAYLFRRNGFEVIDVYTDYDDQYLMIEAKPGPTNRVEDVAADPEDLERIKSLVQGFVDNVKVNLDAWREKLAAMRSAGKKVVIWGSGSKGVSFLTTLGITGDILYCVDINPRKHGKFMAGTGQEIVAPDFLKDYQPDVVIVMNPVYVPEIQADLDRMGVQAEIMTV